jgi:hypothetical protein
MTFSPNSIRAARRSQETQAASEKDVASVVPTDKPININALNKKPRSEDRGTFAGRATIAGR